MRAEDFHLLEKMIFTTSNPDASSHDCVLVVDKRHAVTYQHGDHSNFETEQKVTLYSLVDSTLQIEVVVDTIYAERDLLLFKTTGESTFEHFPEPTWFYSLEGKTYHQVGNYQKNRSPEWQEGTILRLSDNENFGHGNTDGAPGNAVFDDAGRVYGITTSTHNNQIIITMPLLIYFLFKTEEDTHFDLQSGEDDF